MVDKDKPTIVVSRCLGFSSCRYNGQIIENKFIEKLRNHVNFLTVCPEVEIGLGIPRDPIRVISNGDSFELYQPSTDKYFTDSMNNFSISFLDSLKEIDGFILKSRSPSCAKNDCKVYGTIEKSSSSIKGPGLFAKNALERFSYTPFEDEGRLTNARIRDHFLTQVFTLHNFRNIKSSNDISQLEKFQNDNKYLLVAYNQKGQKVLGKVLENYNNHNDKEVFNEYQHYLLLTLNKMPRYTTNINALMHIFSHFSNKVSSKEKEFILTTLKNHRSGKIPLSVPLYLLKSYCIQFDEKHLINQSIWCPYPEDLVEPNDSGKPKKF